MSCSGLPMMQTAFSTLQYLGPVDQHARYCNVGYSAASPRGRNLTAENLCTKSAGVTCPVGPPRRQSHCTQYNFWNAVDSVSTQYVWIKPVPSSQRSDHAPRRHWYDWGQISGNSSRDEICAWAASPSERLGVSSRPRADLWNDQGGFLSLPSRVRKRLKPGLMWPGRRPVTTFSAIAPA